MSEQLSPAAQAILHSFWNAPVTMTRGLQIAAALQAAADQVVPQVDIDESDYDCLHAKWIAQGRQEVRYEILAIVAKLNDTQTTSENV